MGMLFNTPTTLQALSMVNSGFRQTKFQAFQNALAQGTPPKWATDLYDAFLSLSTALPGAGDIYQVANMHPLYLDFDTTSEPGKSASINWKAFLKLLDNNPNKPLKISCSARIALEICRAAKDPLCNAIEYFAVPADGIIVVVSYLESKPSPTPPIASYTSIITVETNTFDKVAAEMKARKKPKKY